MKLALFDLDNTLISGDSDCLWGQFLVDHGLVDGETYQVKHNQFYQDYKQGSLDIEAFLAFQLYPLTQHHMSKLKKWHAQYMEKFILPAILPKARALIESHRAQNHELMIITATCDFLTAPIANEFGISNLISCQAEIENGQYTGKIVGRASYAEGKIARLQEWLRSQQAELDESWFYSDSHTDLPLLGQVNHPIAVDPDPILYTEAQKHGWNIISLR